MTWETWIPFLFLALLAGMIGLGAWLGRPRWAVTSQQLGDVFVELAVRAHGTSEALDLVAVRMGDVIRVMEEQTRRGPGISRIVLDEFEFTVDVDSDGRPWTG